MNEIGHRKIFTGDKTVIVAICAGNHTNFLDHIPAVYFDLIFLRDVSASA